VVEWRWLWLCLITLDSQTFNVCCKGCFVASGFTILNDELGDLSCKSQLWPQARGEKKKEGYLLFCAFYDGFRPFEYTSRIYGWLLLRALSGGIGDKGLSGRHNRCVARLDCSSSSNSSSNCVLWAHTVSPFIQT
jgi:hypothetical protein